MHDEYDLPTDEVIDRLERIERRLDNMGQRIAYLEGNLGQRVAFLEGVVFGPERRADAPSRKPMSADAYARQTKVFIRTCQIMMAVSVLLNILIWFYL